MLEIKERSNSLNRLATKETMNLQSLKQTRPAEMRNICNEKGVEQLMEVKRSEMLGWREGVRAFERSDSKQFKGQ